MSGLRYRAELQPVTPANKAVQYFGNSLVSVRNWALSSLLTGDYSSGMVVEMRETHVETLTRRTLRCGRR